MIRVPELRVTALHARLIRLVNGTRYQVRGNMNAMAYNAECGSFAVKLPNRDIILVEEGGHCSLPKGTDHEIYVAGHRLCRVQRLEAPFVPASVSNDSGSLVFATSIAASTNPLPDIVPEVVTLTRQEMTSGHRLDLVFGMLRQHAACEGEDRSQISNRLAEIAAIILIEHVLREFKAEGLNAAAGMSDPHIRRVLQAIHESPQEEWSLEGLARHGGLSRSVLAERFKATVGQPPIDYLTRVRMARATRLLETAELSVADVAFRVGYQSDASFHKAFRRMMGVSPSSYRRARLR